MNDEPKAKALITLADLANSVSGDMHAMHLNMRGAEFDTMHKNVLKEYYEQAAEDYDSLAEWACCFSEEGVPNPNESAARIEFQSFVGTVDRARAIERTNEILEELCKYFLSVFKMLEEQDCPVCIGIANWLQGRLEYWSKELAYFNAARRG